MCNVFRLLAFSALFSILSSCSVAVKEKSFARNFTFQFPVEMLDVSFLMPLPAQLEHANLLIGAETKAKFGDILPQWLWEKIPALRSGMQKEEVRKELKLVAVRLDPCFREGLDVHGQPCKPQVRLVLQPVYFDTVLGVVSTRDTALHLFYQLELDTLTALISRFQMLTAQQRHLFVNAPVDVHPVLATEGYKSATYKKFETELLNEIGESRLTRVTFMTVAGFDVQWTFGGFDVIGENMAKSIVIPGTHGNDRQTITSNTSYPVPMHSSIVPIGKAKDNLTEFGAGESLLNKSAEHIEATMLSLHRVTNPTFHNPGTVDCVSCHIVTMARAWSLEKNIPSAESSEHSYKSKYNTTNSSKSDARESVLRAFGYFREKSAVSLRTLNETDSVVRHLNE